ncbi:MAG: SLC13 family permease [Thermoplasmatota archaeon]
MDGKRLFKFALPVLLLLVILLLPRPADLSYEGQAMFAILAFAASAFLLQPVPLGVTGIVILVLPLIIGVTDVKETFESFGNSAVFFLIGAFIIAAAIETTDIHKKVSLHFLRIVGRSTRLLVLGTMLSGATLSFILPQHGVIVLIVPVLMFTIVSMGLVPLRSNLAKAMMIGAAYGCTVGSLATPLGGARNPLTIGFLSSQGIKMDFLRWMILSMPIVILSLFAVWVVLIMIFPPERIDLKMSKRTIRQEVKELPRLGRRSWLIVVALVLLIVAFIMLPTFWDVEIALIALVGSIILFIMSGMRWDELEAKIPWGIILLYGGAISLGIHLANSGAAVWLAENILEATHGSILISLALLILLTKLLTEIMSNTAAVSILLPIGFAVFTELGLPPEMGAMLVAFSGGLAFMFLISTPGNLISFSSGYFSQKDLFKAGVLANLATIAVILLVAYTYWKMIGVW